jgi:hypothetical protein
MKILIQWRRVKGKGEREKGKTVSPKRARGVYPSLFSLAPSLLKA